MLAGDGLRLAHAAIHRLATVAAGPLEAGTGGLTVGFLNVLVTSVVHEHPARSAARGAGRR